MAQYLIAQWDYTAEGDFELSFKEGDQIKLLEKHNNDWWEGELNDEIGFFPANRTITPIANPTNTQSNTLETGTIEELASDLANKVSITSQPVVIPRPHGSKRMHSNPYLANQEQDLVDTTVKEQDLPDGWSQSFDENSGTTYYFEKNTGKSQWEKPTAASTSRLETSGTEEQKKNLLPLPAPKNTLTKWFSRPSKNSNKHLSQQDLVFGGYLKLDENGDIPLVVKLCIHQVDQRGLDVVGIYRLSGQSTSIQRHKHLFDSDRLPPLDSEPDINVITGLLKLYFRELKNPLLTFEYYDRFLEAARLEEYDEQMFRLKAIIQVLPVAHYKVLQYLVEHLDRVQQQSKVNKMEASNLALIFAIGLLRPKHENLSASILHTDLVSKVVEMLILHVDWFFGTDTSTDEEDDDINMIEL